MIMFPINTGGGNVSNKSMLALYITFNIVILIALAFMYYLFLHDSYKGSFWNWSWDYRYFLSDKETNAAIAGPFVFLPFLITNGIALIFGLTMIIEETILRKME